MWIKRVTDQYFCLHDRLFLDRSPTTEFLFSLHISTDISPGVIKHSMQMRFNLFSTVRCVKIILFSIHKLKDGSVYLITAFDFVNC